MGIDKSPALDRNAEIILKRRYLKKDDRGEVVESPEEMFRRVARNISSVSIEYGDRDVGREEEEFFDMMVSLDFLPNSPTLMNAGTEIQQLVACFVIPIEDSIESIYDAVKSAALIHQSGGGTGFSFSKLRPSGDIVGSTGGVASGPLSFMKVFDVATEAIKQGGRRRGASMGILRVDHPDIRGFIHSKGDPEALKNFNISVAVTDDFMERVSGERDYHVINPRTGESWGTLNASEILEEISHMAVETGDPGLIFVDEINRDNPTPLLGDIEATNPCGEVPLLPYEACNLGSIDLSRLTDGERFDWERFRELVHKGIRFLDNVIDATRFPMEETETIVTGNRKIGLGVMGFADSLIKMGMTYGSEASLEFASELSTCMREEAEKESTRIAESRGSFPNIEKSVLEAPRRNATVLSIAPTGTISMIAGCSSGIEPIYAVSYTKNVMEEEHLRITHPYFLQLSREEGFYSDELIERVSRKHSIQDMEAIPEEVRDLFPTAHDVLPREQVKIQSIFQENVDNAVSKTINLPGGYGQERVKEIFKFAHQLGCKGITVYREGARSEQVLTLDPRKTCPKCGAEIGIQEGSFVCKRCGYS